MIDRARDAGLAATPAVPYGRVTHRWEAVMREPTLVIGTRNYSSWSLRPWLLLRHLGIRFSERLVHFGTEEFAREVPRLSPSGCVPVLLHADLAVWESLAICEYASELAQGAGWPASPGARAQARAIAAEMHAGFPALRQACPMNARARDRRVPLTPALQRDIARIDSIWSDCRKVHGSEGPWLFGSYSAADAMFAPVALRFLTYGLPLDGAARDYQQCLLADPPLREWMAAAEVEGVIVAEDEAGVPA
jgi:glutathione S-transferase